MNIMTKACNGYRIIYHGNEKINIPEFVYEDDMAYVLGNISPEDRDLLSYEEVILGKEKD